MVVAKLFKAGAHVPVIPFVDVVGNGLNAAPEQIEGTVVNSGITFGLTVMIIVAGTAHIPAAGVNVYVVVFALSKEGAHVPVIPLDDIAGKGLRAAPEHIAATCTNVGVTGVVIKTLMVVSMAHCPAVCVNV